MAEPKKYHLDELVAAAVLAVMSIITFLNVLNRYILHKSFAFSEEITINLFVWMTILGIAIAFRRGSNLQMTNLYDVFPAAVKRVVIVISGVVGIVIFAFLMYNSVREIYKNMTFYHTTSDSLGIPTWIYSLGTPVFSLFVIKELISTTISGARKTKDSGGQGASGGKEGNK